MGIATRPVVRLDDQYVQALSGEAHPGRQSTHAAAHDHDVVVIAVGNFVVGDGGQRTSPTRRDTRANAWLNRSMRPRALRTPSLSTGLLRQSIASCSKAISR